MLCNLYEKTLARDPSYKDYLIQIGQIYFGIEKKAQSAGLFSNLIQSLFDMSDNNGEATHSNNLTSSNIVPHKNQDVDLD